MPTDVEPVKLCFEQELLLARIDHLKSKGGDKKLLARLARELTSYDRINTWHCDDPGGRSRSPSFGRWGRD